MLKSEIEKLPVAKGVEIIGGDSFSRTYVLLVLHDGTKINIPCLDLVNTISSISFPMANMTVPLVSLDKLEE